MSERRAHHRIPVYQLMEARLLVDGVASSGQVVDLNNAGAFVACDLVLAKNASLVVELRFPGESKSLPLKAIVARRTQTEPDPALDFPTLEDGARGVRFIEAAVESSNAGGVWVDSTLEI